jgi:hypothetical protein
MEAEKACEDERERDCFRKKKSGRKRQRDGERYSYSPSFPMDRSAVISVQKI